MRELKFHEQKLLKKVNFLQWKSDQNVREIQVLRRYHVQNRDDYVKYSKVAGLITKLAAKAKLLKQDDPVRTKTTNLLIDKLFNMGLIPTKKSLLQCEALPVSAFCRRRIPVVLVRMKFCETLKEAVTFVEQGHIRVGKLFFLSPVPPPPTPADSGSPSTRCALVGYPTATMVTESKAMTNTFLGLSMACHIDMEDPNSN